MLAARILFLQKSEAKKDFVLLSWYCIILALNIGARNINNGEIKKKISINLLNSTC